MHAMQIVLLREALAATSAPGATVMCEQYTGQYWDEHTMEPPVSVMPVSYLDRCAHARTSCVYMCDPAIMRTLHAEAEACTVCVRERCGAM